MRKTKTALRIAAYVVALPLISEVSGCTNGVVTDEIRGTESTCRQAYGDYYNDYRDIQETSGRIGFDTFAGLLGLTLGLKGASRRKRGRK